MNRADKLYKSYYDTLHYSNKYFPLCILCWCCLIIIPYSLFGLIVDFVRWKWGDPDYTYTRPVDARDDDEERNAGYAPGDESSVITVQPHRNMTTMFFRAGVVIPHERQLPPDDNAKQRGECLTEETLDKMFPAVTYSHLKEVLLRETEASKMDKADSPEEPQEDISEKLSEDPLQKSPEEPQESSQKSSEEISEKSPEPSETSQEDVSENDASPEQHPTPDSQVTLATPPQQARPAVSKLLPVPAESSSLMCTICQCVIGKEDAYDDSDSESTVEAIKASLADVSGNTQGGSSASPPSLHTHGDILVRRLTCNHVFHDECIREWLCEVKGSCPLCSRDYTVDLLDDEKKERERGSSF